MLSGIAWGTLLAIYMAAKLHFLTRYDALALGAFVREHSVFWIGMALACLVMWLLSRKDDKRDPENSGDS